MEQAGEEAHQVIQNASKNRFNVAHIYGRVGSWRGNAYIYIGDKEIADST